MKKIYIIVLTGILGLIAYLFFFNNGKVYTLKEYSPKGKLLGTNEYIIRNGDTILQGKFINYNEKGTKISEGQFVNGHVKGKCIYYYDNGKIETVQFKNNKITEESIFYNQNGSIDNYTMYNFIGKTVFIISFDEGSVKKYDGYSILPLEQYKLINKKKYEIKTGDFLKVGDTIGYNYLVANIPHTKRTFKIQNVGTNNSKSKRIIKSKLPAEIIVEEILTKKGLNRIEIIAQYKFDDKITPTLNKTVSFDVNVN